MIVYHLNLMICSLFGTSPKHILTELCGQLPHARLRQPRAAQSSNQNFIHRGYAQQHYPEEDIHQIFHELEARSILWPDIHDTHLSPEQRHLHCLWSNMWMGYWFEKWYWKYRKGEEKK